MTDKMEEEILETYPEFKNRLYIVGGSRREALREAMSILLRLTDRCYVSTEWYCLKDGEEEIRNTVDEVAAATGLGKSARDLFRTVKCGNVEFVKERIWGSYSRRFVRMTFIDSLEALHLRGQSYNREDVIKKLRGCPNPVIVVSDEILPIGPDTVQYNTNGTTFSLTVRG